MVISFIPSFGQVNNDEIEKKIFIYGGGPKIQFIKYIAQLTGKEKPKLCFLPTASGDNTNVIDRWYKLCRNLNVEPYVMKVWINSRDQKESWQEVLEPMDAVIVGGGNTLNMIAIWKAQEIDKALKDVYEKGVIMAGGSAGSLCWFEGGTTDSRPKKLSLVKGLAFLEYSHCPHYSTEKERRPLYHKNILTGKLGDGYACDDKAGILFINGKAARAVSLDDHNNSYYVYEKNGKIIEEKLESLILK